MTVNYPTEVDADKCQDSYYKPECGKYLVFGKRLAFLIWYRLLLILLFLLDQLASSSNQVERVYTWKAEQRIVDQFRDDPNCEYKEKVQPVALIAFSFHPDKENHYDGYQEYPHHSNFI